MIELRPEIVERRLRFLALTAGGLGMRCCLPGATPLWPLPAGGNILLRWSGERLPLPILGDPAERQPEIVGFAFASASQIDTYADVTHAANTIYHFGVLQVGGGGVVTVLDPFDVVTRTFDGAAALRGYMPNAPSALQVRLLPGNLPHFSWSYSAARQQVAPATFRVFVSSGAAFDFGTPAASVTYQAGRTRYDWTGTALAAGARRWYTVRAASGAGVLSLIPRMGLCPAGSYDAVDLGACAMLHVPAGPPAVVSYPVLEVTR